MRRDGVEEVLALSPLQVEKHLAASGTQVLPLVQVRVDLRGTLEVPLLVRAWQEVLLRQPALRAALVEGGDETPAQAIHRSVAVPFLHVNGTAAARLEEDLAAALDLARPPLFHVVLFEGEANTWRLAVTGHPLFLDGPSLRLVVRDALARYAAHRAGDPVPESEPLPYGAVLRASGEGCNGGASSRTWEFREVASSLGHAMGSRLRTAARRHGLAPATLLLGAWAQALAGDGGGDEVRVGVAMPGRPEDLDGAAELAGPFRHTQPMRIAVASGDPRPAAWLRRLQARQWAPAELRDEPPGSVRSLFLHDGHRAMNSWRPIGPDLAITGVEIREPLESSLAAVVIPDDEVLLALRYAPDEYDGERMRRLLEAFEERTVSLVTALLVAEAPGWTAEPGFGSVVERFEAMARRQGERQAVTFESNSLDYGTLDCRANQLARHLRDLGIDLDVPVALFLERSLDLVVAILAVVKAGGAYMPLDPELPRERLGFQLEDAGVGIVLTQEALVERLPESSARVVAMDSMGDLLAAMSPQPLGVRVEPGTLAYVIYTSGTTGRSKGVLINHRNLCRLLTSTQPWFEFGSEDVWALFHSYAFDFSVWELWGALTTGGRLVVVPYWVSRSAERFHGLLVAEQVTVLNQTPAAFYGLIRADQAAETSQELALRWVIFGGEALDLNSLVPWLERHGDREPRLVNMYGITETTVHVTFRPLSLAECTTQKKSLIGVPIPDLDLYVVDRRLRSVPLGVPGEICVGGAGPAMGYLKRPGLTAERFVPDPFGTEPGGRLYRSGDLARFLPRRDLEYLGRIDSQVKIRGFRIELGEIEAALMAHPGVERAVVLAQKDVARGDRLVGYFLGEQGTPISAADLKAFLEQKLPHYMVPQRLVEVEEIRQTSQGKIDRRALQALGERRAVKRYEGGAMSPREELLAGIWAEVLQLDSVGPEEDFFALGGHSLVATQVISRVRRTFQVELPLRSLFQGPTVRALAVRIGEEVEACSRPLTAPIVPIDDEGEPPLSFAQQRLWFLDELQPGNPFYNIPGAMDLEGPLGVSALEATLSEIVRRHEVLRTVYAKRDGRAIQVIGGPFAVRIPVVDLSGLAEGRRAEVAAGLMAEEARRPFVLSRGPLLRMTLLRLREHSYRGLFSLHHIVGDAWSVGLMIREIGLLYAAFRRGEPSPLEELPVRYADFAHWQQRLAGEAMATQLVWWKRRLSGAPKLLELPTDRPRPPAPTFRGAVERHQLSLRLTASLAALGRKHGTTLFMTLLATFQTLLSRYSGQLDVSLGTPVAGRNRLEIEGLIGCFINTLVLRTDLSGDPTFVELLGRVREVALDAHTYQDLPFEKVVEALQPERSLSYMPLFQVWFTLQNVPLETLELGEVEIRPREVESETSKFDLNLTLSETEDGLHAMAEYSLDLFTAVTVRRLLKHFETLLGDIVAAPEKRLDELSLLNASEIHELLVTRNATTVAYPAGEGMQALLAAACGNHPDAVALWCGNEGLSYEELGRRARRLAYFLARREVGRGDRVGLYLEHSLESVVTILGVLDAGAAYVPLDPSHPDKQLEFIVEDAGVKLLLTQEWLADRAWLGEMETVRLDTGWSAVAACESVELYVAGPEDLAYVIYTSGSTGKPKGVEICHRSLVDYASWATAVYVRSEEVCFALYSPLAFDLTVTSVFPPLLTGNRIAIYPDRGDEPVILSVLRDDRAEVLKLTPSHLALIREMDNRRSRVRRMIVGGEALTTQVARATHRSFGRAVEILNEYGPTEATVGCMIHRFDPDRDRRETVPIGLPAANTRLYVLDDGLRPVAENVTGELYIAGAGLARGYLNRPERTRASFIDDPFVPGERMYKSGDLVRWLSEGGMEFVGRRDEQVKFHGYRVELNGIRSVLEEHPGVRQAVVVLRHDAEGTAFLMAFYVARKPIDAEELRAFLGERLLRETLPNFYVHLRRLPLTLQGKVNLDGLPSIDEVRGRLKREFEAPRSPEEKILARIWAEFLRLEKVGIRDNFFELGGDSILSIQVISRAAREGLSCTPKQLFENPTIAGLAAVVEVVTERGEAHGPVVGEVPLTPIQHWFFAQELVHPEHFNQALLLEVAPPPTIGEPSAAVLARAIELLEEHHDALRLRFRRRPDGGWEQRNSGVEKLARPFAEIDLGALPESVRGRALERAAARLQGSLNLVEGPLFRVVSWSGFAAAGRRDRLLFLVHHLAVDGVSWRVLLDDLEAICRLLGERRPVQLPPRTTSYQRWAELLTERATSEAMAAEARWWSERLEEPPPALPWDFPERLDTVAGSRRVEVALDEEATWALLREVPRAYRTEINDVLLCALVEALAPWLGSRRVGVDLEGHGREEIVEGVELARTVGWFTAIYPVILDLRGVAAEPGSSLRAVKEQLRSVPGKGLGYGLLRYLADDATVAAFGALPRSGISFNYLGQLDSAVRAEGMFRPAAESAGGEHHPRQGRSHPLEVLAAVRDGRLGVRFVYPSCRLQAATVEALAQRFLGSLRELIVHCLAKPTPGATPSDFPLVKLDQPTLDRLMASVGEIEDLYKTSPLQQGMLYHTLSSPGSGVYVVQLSLALYGPLRPPAFERAWRRLVDRHPLLRTAFLGFEFGEPLQVVLPTAEVGWVEEDWRSLSGDEQKQRLEAFLARDRRRGFDVAQPPLLRLALMRWGEGSWRFVLSFHHLLLDGWSMSVLLRELFALYESARREEELSLPPVAPYRGFIVWLGSRDLRAAETFWRQTLAGFSSPTPLLESLVAEPPVGEPEYAIRERWLSAPLTRKLRAWAKLRRLTFNTVVQGAWALLLSRYTGERDVVFGVVSSGRSAPVEGIDSMLGLFINTLPARLEVALEARLGQWLQAFQEHQAAVRQYEYTPLSQVQGWSEAPAGSALFETILAFENYPVDDTALAQVETSLRFGQIEAHEQTNYPINVMVFPNERLGLRLLHDVRRFGPVVLERMLHHFETLLAGMLEGERRFLGSMPLLNAAERHQTTVEWNDTARELSSAALLHELFDAQVARRPEAIAVLGEGGNLSYAGLAARANQLAHALRTLGVRPGTLVAVYFDRSVEMVTALLGILKAGGAYVPLETRNPPSRLRLIVDTMGIEVVLVGASCLADAAELGSTPTHFVCLDPLAEGAAPAFAEGQTLHPLAAVEKQPHQPPELLGRRLDDLAYIIFTSGSTGVPKGVMERHRPVLNLIEWIRRSFDMEPEDRVLFITSLGFDLSVYDIFGLLAAGGSVRVASSEEVQDPRRLAEILEHEPITFWDSAPAALQQLVPFLSTSPDRRGKTALRLVFLSGDWIPLSLPDQVRASHPGAQVIALGGATEATVWSNFFPIGEVAEGWRSIPYGRPIDNAAYYVLAPELSPLPMGVAGDLFIGGGCLSSGYAQAPERSAWSFLPDLFRGDPGSIMYRTGDRARFFPNGNIEFLGRVDHQVKIRGFRIELGEIEAQLHKHEAVREVLVMAREDHRGQKQLVAYVIPGAQGADEKALEAHLEERLPGYMVPAAFVFLESFPVTTNGKLDRAALPAPERAGERSGEALVAPRNAIEERLAQWWRQVLGVPEVGVHDNFFDLGGDSILSIQLISRAGQEGIRLSPAQIFEFPTIAELARVVAPTAVDRPVDGEGPTLGEVPLTPIQHWFLEQGLEHPEHFNLSLLLAPAPATPRWTVPLLSRTVVYLAAHHDALRLRWTPGESPGAPWRQTCAAPRAGAEIFCTIDLSVLPEAAWRRAFEGAAARLQASLDLSAGPVARVAWFAGSCPEADRLLWIIHHLAVDGVSWRILLEDFEALCRQLEGHLELFLPPRTTSYKRWSEHLHGLATSPALRAREPQWLEVVRSPWPSLPVDCTPASSRNTVEASRHVRVRLDEVETRALLREVPRAYRTQIGDVLLTALLQAVAPWSGWRTLVVDLESHGRDDLGAGLDTSRTVGWFTSIYPVVLHLEEVAATEPGAALKAIKEQLRSMAERAPSFGILRYLNADAAEALRSAPRPEVLFNYLGQLDQAVAEGRWFRPAPEAVGAERHGAQQRSHLLEVSSAVQEGRLWAGFTYSTSHHREETVRTLADRFLAALRTLIDHCRSLEEPGSTPSDFPLAGLDQPALDRLVARAGGEIEDLFPAAPTQQGMLFHTLHAPGSGVYVVQLGFTLRGALDEAACERAWQRLLERHGILRTGFYWPSTGVPQQVVLRHVELPWVREDWRHLSPDEREEHLRTFLAEDRRRELDIARPPLLRLAVLRFEDDLFHLVWTFHHVLFDGWSTPILLREFFVLYEEERGRGAAELASVRPYRDFIAWLAVQDEEEAADFWRRELAGFETPTPLIGDRGAGKGLAPGTYRQRRRRLSAAATMALTAMARASELTLNTVMQGAWALLLARASGEPDVVFGAVTAGRSLPIPGIDGIVGLFINTLPARVRVEPHADLGTWLGTLQRRQVTARKYEYSSLVEVQGWSEVGRGRPLFESTLVFENYPVDESLVTRAAGELGVERVMVEEQTNYPLAIQAEPGERLSIRMQFDTSRFDTTTAHRLLHQLEALLGAMAERPADPLVALLPFTAAERHQQLVEWNDTAAPLPPHGTLHEMFAAQARRTPEAIAVSDPENFISYVELDRRAAHLAVRLRDDLGVGTEAIVGVFLEPSVGLLVGLFGILQAGAAYLPLDPAYPHEHLAFLCEDSRITTLLSRWALGDRLPPTDAPVFFLESAEERFGESVPAATWAARPENAAYVIYTSGSSGRPKGAVIPHLAIVNQMYWLQDVCRLRATDSLLQKTSFSFDGSVWEFYAPFLVGARLVMPRIEELKDPRGMSERMHRERVTVLKVVPSLLQALMEEPKFRSLTIMRCLVAGGEKMSSELRDRYLRAPGGLLVHAYGPTEATVNCSVKPYEVHRKHESTVTMGRQGDSSRAYVVDPTWGPAPLGMAGELLVGDLHLARGYLKRPGLTAERFVPDPWSGHPGARLYRTGDLVRRHLPAGELEFRARVDHQVKLRGFRIEPGEIESTLERHPGVVKALVVVREDLPGGRGLVAYVVGSEGGAPPSAELRRFARERLPEHYVPQAFEELEEIPYTTSTKALRRGLPAPTLGRPAEGATLLPSSRLEKAVADIWAEALGLEQVGLEDNIFDLGGHSLILVGIRQRLNEELGCDLSLVDLFRYTTVKALVQFLEGVEMVDLGAEEERPTFITGAVEIAVVGAAGRFPGARNLEEFWRNLEAGVESITFFGEDELREAGVSPFALADPNYVPAHGRLSDLDLFDAEFFGFTPREAEVTDPQHRLFLESAWQALEDAGYDPERFPGRIGVFAGSSASSYWHDIFRNPEIAGKVGARLVMMGNDKDFLATRTSYKLNLRGPSFGVQTACSTSLVAVHMACQSLRDGEADMALAGGVAVRAHKAGYVYEQGGILSPDGHCRAFDAGARGTLPGDGVGVVVLKRLADALRDGDTIRGMIRGSASNNDGARKAGFTAPSIEGQVAVIRDALALGGVDPASVSYVEAHGTGTELGDPIEVEALQETYGAEGEDACALGSVKTNIGHLDAAAGIAGLLKALLALEHGVVPPSLHFESPNPEIDFSRGRFFVAAAPHPWPRREAPRRAGVSSFGIGGTNAHVVLEEAPATETVASPRNLHLVMLSGRTATALEGATARLAAHLEASPSVELADVAFTLGVGRRAFAYRRALVCGDPTTLGARLASGEKVFTGGGEGPAGVVFLFPGQGAQAQGMGVELYATEPAFHREVDRCAELLRPHLRGEDVRHYLFQAEAAGLAETWIAQPALFVLEYALASFWGSLGVRPRAMLGHSLGEYVAATLAEVWSLEEALEVVAVRGRLMQALPGGSMLSVALDEDALADFLGDGVGLAAVNGRGRSVVSGPSMAVAAVASRLSAQGVSHRALETSHAFHSEMMEPMLEPFRRTLERLRPRSPRRPFVSNLTGRWIREAEAVDPGYWVRHLRAPVRFSAGLAELLVEDAPSIFLEVGPGTTLRSLVQRHPDFGADGMVLSSLDGRVGSEREALLHAVGRAWVSGLEVDAAGLWAGETRRRIPLPTYPFERRSFFIEARSAGRRQDPRTPFEKRGDLAEWFYLPSFQPAAPVVAGGFAPGERWLLFVDGSGLGEALGRALRDAGQRVETVRSGDRFAALGEGSHALDPRCSEDYGRLLAALAEGEGPPRRVVHLWNVGKRAESSPERAFAAARERGFDSILHLVQALASRPAADGMPWISVVGSGLQAVDETEAVEPEKAPLLGLLKVVPQELRHLDCQAIDIEDPAGAPAPEVESLVRDLLAELTTERREPTIALRGRRRFLRAYEPVRLEARRVDALRRRGVYLVTGGLGKIGLRLGEHLGRRVGARLALLGRTPFPGREHWEEILAGDGDDVTRETIRRLQALEEAGAEVLLLTADVADLEQMAAALALVRERFGALDGVIHAAGQVGEAVLRSLEESDGEHREGQFRAKVHGLYVLDELLRGDELDFCVLCSSLAGVLGGLGFGAYAAANRFMDAMAGEQRRQGRPWISVGWDGWRRGDAAPEAEPGELVISAAEGVEAFERLLALVPGESRVAVSVGDLDARIERWVRLETPSDDEVVLHPRPAMKTAYRGPESEREEQIVALWQDLLGIDTIGTEDDFFELGGDSLLATQLISSLRRSFQVEVPLRAIFDSSTVRAQAALVEESGSRREELQTASDLLATVEQLSEEAMDAILEAQLSDPRRGDV